MRNCLVINICLAIIFLLLRNSSSSTAVILKRPFLSVGFLFQRTVSIDQRSCTCPTELSCSCCQSVTILLRGVVKNFCVNFGYQRTGLTMNISLGSNIIRRVAIIDYKPFKVCTAIPNCPYSSACVDVLELTLFPRSITTCIQLDVMSKIEKWLINYNCISISTILPNQANTNGTTIVPPTTTNIVLNGTTGMNNLQPMGMPGTGQMNPMQMGMTQMTTQMSAQIPAGQMPSTQMPMGQMSSTQMPMGQMSSTQMPMGQMSSTQMPMGQMPLTQMPMGQMSSTQMPMGQMPSGQMPMGQMPTGQPGQMPNGQMPMGQMPMGQMPPGQIQGSLIRRSEMRGYGKRRKRVLEKDVLKDVQLLREPVDSRRCLDKKKYIFYNPTLCKVYHRSRRNTDYENRTASVKMQVINRRIKNGLPRINRGAMIKILKNWIGSEQRSSRIVNQDTISIPMSHPEVGNTVIPSIKPTTPANGVNYELVSPQPGPSFPPLQGGVFLGGGTVSMDEQIPPNFLVNVDNRTSSFPNRMPPSFGTVFRSLPTDEGKTLLLERSVEELVTPETQIKLGANSKIVETLSTDFTDGRIIFPE